MRSFLNIKYVPKVLSSYWCLLLFCVFFFPPFLLMHLFTYFVQQLYFNEHSCFSALLQYVSPFILFESQCISSLSFSLISLSVDCYKKNIQSRVSSLLSLERLTEISIDCKINKMWWCYGFNNVTPCALKPYINDVLPPFSFSSFIWNHHFTHTLSLSHFMLPDLFAVVWEQSRGTGDVKDVQFSTCRLVTQSHWGWITIWATNQTLDYNI